MVGQITFFSFYYVLENALRYIVTNTHSHWHIRRLCVILLLRFSVMERGRRRAWAHKSNEYAMDERNATRNSNVTNENERRREECSRPKEQQIRKNKQATRKIRLRQIYPWVSFYAAKYCTKVQCDYATQGRDVRACMMCSMNIEAGSLCNRKLEWVRIIWTQWVF